MIKIKILTLISKALVGIDNFFIDVGEIFHRLSIKVDSWKS